MSPALAMGLITKLKLRSIWGFCCVESNYTDVIFVSGRLKRKDSPPKLATISTLQLSFCWWKTKPQILTSSSHERTIWWLNPPRCSALCEFFFFLSFFSSLFHKSFFHVQTSGDDGGHDSVDFHINNNKKSLTLKSIASVCIRNLVCAFYLHASWLANNRKQGWRHIWNESINTQYR